MREFQLAATLHEEGSVPGALEHAHKALQLDPENARAYLLLAYIHAERRAYPDAERNVRTAIRLLGTQEQPSLLAEAKNLLGVILVHQRRFDEGIAILRESASDVMNTAPFFAWGNLGWALYEKGEYDQAIAALQEATRIQPRFCVGHYRMGQSYFAKEDFANAEEALTRAIEADERCTRHYQEAFRLRGEVRARLGRREDAIADFERCLEMGRETGSGSACQRFLEGQHQEAAP